jgi:hypothetical protein
MKKIFLFLLVTVFFTSGFAPLIFADLTADEQKEKYYEDVCSYAQEDAAYEGGNGYLLWTSTGCVLGPVGMALGYFITPSIPPSRIMGRTSTYVEQYSKCYSDAIRLNRLFTSGYGCAMTWGLVAALALSVHFLMK